MSKDYLKFSTQISKTLSRDADDALWHDEKFWSVHWSAMVQRYAEAVEKLTR
jgi:hypothetical protein